MVILDSKDDPVNRVTLSLIRDLQAGVDFLQKSTTPPVIIFRSGKSNGFALGPDLQEWKEFHASGGYAEWQKEGMRLVETISKLPCTTIAAIHGPCMGAGFEIALACDYRLAYARPDTVFSFPETEMGACPSWGMIFRLLKKAGLEASVKLVAFGEKWKPTQLARFGLLDGIATNEQQLRSEFTRLTCLAMLHGKGTTGSKKHRSLRRTILEGNRLSRYLLRRVFERFLKRTACEENTTQASTLKLLANLCAIEDPTNALELISSHAIRLFESDMPKPSEVYDCRLGTYAIPGWTANSSPKGCLNWRRQGHGRMGIFTSLQIHPFNADFHKPFRPGFHSSGDRTTLTRNGPQAILVPRRGTKQAGTIGRQRKNTITTQHRYGFPFLENVSRFRTRSVW